MNIDSKSMRHARRLFVVVLLLHLAVSELSAILRRHDRPDSLYVAFGKKFPGVCLIMPGATATLIAPQWVITAAHVGDGISFLDTLPKLKFGNKEYKIEKIFVHPCWEPPAQDIALLKLTEPVADVDPIPLYRGEVQEGQPAIIVGPGYQGNGQSGPVTRPEWDKMTRAATNRIYAVEDYWLTFVFDEPSTATELEGIGGPADSGCPIIIEADGRYYIIGIGSGSSDKNRDNITGTYGDWDRAARTTNEMQWIDAMMSGGEFDPKCYDKFLTLKWVGGIVLTLALALGLRSFLQS